MTQYTRKDVCILTKRTICFVLCMLQIKLHTFLNRELHLKVHGMLRRQLPSRPAELPPKFDERLHRQEER